MPVLLLLAAVAVLWMNKDIVTGFLGGKPFALELGDIGGGLRLEKRAAEAFNQMSAEARADGIVLRPSGPRSAYRTTEDQASLVAERPTFANAVGFSPHQRGIAIDLETANGTNAAFGWLQLNAFRFGFVPSKRTDEPWHWQFEG